MFTPLCVTYHMSCVTRHMSYVICHICLQIVELVDGGSVINGVYPIWFLRAERTLRRHHFDHILISGDPQFSNLLMCSTRLKRQRAPISQAWHSEEPARDPQCSTLFSLSSDLYIKVQVGGSPEIGAPPSVFWRESPQKQGGTCFIWVKILKNLADW